MENYRVKMRDFFARWLLLLGVVAIITVTTSGALLAQKSVASNIQTVSEAVQDLDGDGVMDNIDMTLSMSGRASVDNWVFNDQTLSFYLQDHASGIQVFSGTIKKDIKAGDSLIVIGKLQLYYDKPEIIADSVILVEAERKKPAAKLLGSVMQNPERYLGMFTSGEATVAQTNSGSGFRGVTLSPSDTSKEFIEIYVSQSHAYRGDFSLDKLRVGDKVNVKGIIGKFTYDNEERVIYQIMPRTPDDVEVVGLPRYYSNTFSWIIGIIIVLIIGWVVTLKRRVKAQTKELSRALEEKEILMQEMHHRVKNNLAKISALLDLQISTANHPAVEESLSNSKSRINSMALVHDKLYQTQTYKTVRLDSYLKELISTIHKTFHSKHENVNLAFELTPVEIPVEKVVVCGLLVNELIVNAYKYAFDTDREGELKVKLANASGTIELSISDNGPGLPEDFETLIGKGLGSILIKNFSKQLDATMQVNSDGQGTMFSFTFQAND